MDSRQMQIEFERRLTLMSDQFEIKEKPTSDTIFSFLNAYAERFGRNNYLQEDGLQDGTRALKKNADSLKGLITRVSLPIAAKDADSTDNSSDRAILPEDYFLYIRSNSVLSKNYKLEVEITDKLKYVITPNKTIREDDVERIISTYYNKAIILSPYIVLNAGNNKDTAKQLYINIIHDDYTIVKSLDLVYYRRIKKFDVIGVDGINILDRCELPDNVHMEIVEGALEMFITEARYRLSTKQSEQ